MNRRFVALTTIAGTTSLIPVDVIMDVDQVIREPDDEGSLPRVFDTEDGPEQTYVLTTRIRYLVEDGYEYRYVVHTPEEVLKLISIAR